VGFCVPARAIAPSPIPNPQSLLPRYNARYIVIEPTLYRRKLDMWAPFVFGFRKATRGPARSVEMGWLWRLERRASTLTSALARPRRQAVRAGRPQIRHPASPRGEAAPRLRDHQGPREPVRRLLRAKPGDRLPHPDHARRPRLRARRA
jgi:hypothetical protein